jgi:hypothetical protein
MADKESKAAVDYGPGMAERHCGPTRIGPRGQHWPTGNQPTRYCKFYLDNGACQKVEGTISRADWCKRFQAKA